jgi:hypothetical protein
MTTVANMFSSNNKKGVRRRNRCLGKNSARKRKRHKNDDDG